MATRDIDVLPEDVERELSRCGEELEKVIRDQNQDQQNNRAVPPLLYHYTDEAGLAGIIETGTIRLSDIHKLNDPSEIRHGLQSLYNLLERYCAREPAALFVNQFIDVMQQNLGK